MARNQMFWVPGDHFFGARNFSDFLGFSTSPNIASCCAPGTSGIRDFHFLLGVGIRAPHSEIRRLGASIHSLHGVRDCRLRIPDSAIYIYLLPINRPCGRYVIHFWPGGGQEGTFTVY